MKDSMFEAGQKFDDYDSDEEEDKDLFSRIINAPKESLIRWTAGLLAALGAVVGIFVAYKIKFGGHND